MEFLCLLRSLQKQLKGDENNVDMGASLYLI